MARVSAESGLGKSYVAQLDKLQTEIQAAMTQKQTELGKMDAAIKALQDELEKQGSVLSQEAREKKQVEITRKTRERDAFLEDGQAEINRMRERANQQAQQITTRVPAQGATGHRAGGEGEGLRPDHRLAVRLHGQPRLRHHSPGDRAGGRAQRRPPRPPRPPRRPQAGRAQAVGSRRFGAGVRRVRPGRALPIPMSSGEVGRLVRQLPTQYPFVLVDRIVEHDSSGRLVAAKNVTGSEDFFQGHFPGQPVMPGVLILESLAQAAGIWLLKAAPDPRAVEIRVVGFDDTKFRRPVVPGDQLELEVRLVHRRGDLVRFHGEVRVGEARAAEARLLLQVATLAPPAVDPLARVASGAVSRAGRARRSVLRRRSRSPASAAGPCSTRTS